VHDRATPLFHHTAPAQHIASERRDGDVIDHSMAESGSASFSARAAALSGAAQPQIPSAVARSR
jgi:hypothetical protein